MEDAFSKEEPWTTLNFEPASYEELVEYWRESMSRQVATTSTLQLRKGLLPPPSCREQVEKPLPGSWKCPRYFSQNGGKGCLLRGRLV